MKIEQRDPRDLAGLLPARFRVNTYMQDVSGGWSVETHELSDCDVAQALDWARDSGAGATSEVLVVLELEHDLVGVRIFGEDPIPTTSSTAIGPPSTE